MSLQVGRQGSECQKKNVLKVYGGVTLMPHAHHIPCATQSVAIVVSVAVFMVVVATAAVLVVVATVLVRVG